MKLDKSGSFLFKPVDAASIVFFRICFGFLLLFDVYRYFTKDWIYKFYIDPGFHFKYKGFSWVEPWAGNGMYWHFAALGVLAFMIMTGAFYRIATVLFLIGFSYVFLLDSSYYLNHFYLVILIGLLMCFVPAHRSFSIDAWRNPAIRSRTIPNWGLLIMLVQLEIVLFYAGFVKINPDWLQLEPLGSWVSRFGHTPLIGPMLTEKWVVAVAAYGVIALHIFGAPLLFWKKTRLAVFWVYVAFHLSNHFFFQIGIFPWLTIAATTLFFEPDWPRRLARSAMTPLAQLAEVRVPDLRPRIAAAIEAPTYGLRAHAVVAGLAAAWIGVQVSMPLRHFVIPGDVAWTEDAHRFSWRMKLRDKNGAGHFVVQDLESGRRWEIDPRRYLKEKQCAKC